MALTILNAKDYSNRLKVTIQATGKLGFTETTANALNLSANKFAVLAMDEAKCLYIAIVDNRRDDAFKVCLAGKYYYLSTTSLFKTLGYEFETQNIMFDLIRDESFDEDMGGQAYKMKQRPINEKKEKGGQNM